MKRLFLLQGLGLRIGLLIWTSKSAGRLRRSKVQIRDQNPLRGWIGEIRTETCSRFTPAQKRTKTLMK